MAEELGARTVSFPAVSAGVYGWDGDEVARIALAAVRRHPADRVDGVRFVLFSYRLLAAFEAAQSR